MLLTEPWLHIDIPTRVVVRVVFLLLVCRHHAWCCIHLCFRMAGPCYAPVKDTGVPLQPCKHSTAPRSALYSNCQLTTGRLASVKAGTASTLLDAALFSKMLQ